MILISENDGDFIPTSLYTYKEMQTVLQKYEELLTIFLLGIEQYREGYFDLLVEQGIFEEDLPLWKKLITESRSIVAFVKKNDKRLRKKIKKNKKKKLVLWLHSIQDLNEDI